MINNSLLQAKRLEKFARRLMSMDIKPRIKVVNTRARLFMIDLKFIGELPLMFGPLQQLPRIFKDDWVMKENGNVYWVEDRSQHPINSMQLFFNLSLGQVLHIMVPGAQIVNLYGGKLLTAHCKSSEVGANILHLIQSQIISQELLTTINVEFSKN